MASSYLFLQANGLTRAVEKGFVIDNGGPTNYGVTIPFLKDYWKKIGKAGDPTETDIRNLTSEEADEAYEMLIWNPLQCGFMPPGVGYSVFDAAVNSGVRQAAIWLQRAVKVIPDGLIGSQTIAAITRKDPILIIRELAKMRSALVLGMNNANEERYEKGWHIRLIDVTADAILMNLGKFGG